MVDSNLKKVRRVLIIIFFANILVAVLKIIVGGLIKITSMLADGYHSLSDGSSNIVGLIGIWYASKPEDKEHPYGHSKFETLAGLFIGIMLTMVATLLVNILVSRYEFAAGKKFHSHILISDSLNTKADIYVSLGVLLTIMGIKLGLPNIIDPIVSIIVGFFIFHAVYEILKENCAVLVDRQ